LKSQVSPPACTLSCLLALKTELYWDSLLNLPADAIDDLKKRQLWQQLEEEVGDEEDQGNDALRNKGLKNANTSVDL